MDNLLRWFNYKWRPLGPDQDEHNELLTAIYPESTLKKQRQSVQVKVGTGSQPSFASPPLEAYER